MKKKRAGKLRIVVLVAAVLVALMLLPSLLPPKLPVYAIESRPLVQQVVATGRLITTSRSQVGSEITATVVERHVREGDRV